MEQRLFGIIVYRPQSSSMRQENKLEWERMKLTDSPASALLSDFKSLFISNLNLIHYRMNVIMSIISPETIILRSG